MKRFLSSAAIAAMMLLAFSGCGNKKNSPLSPAEEPARDMSQYMPSLEIGSEAPDFEAPDVMGHPVKLSDYNGKYVVLDFWASWCKDCRAEMPAMKKLYTAYAPKDVEFLGVSFDTDLQTLVDYGMEADIPWMQVCNQIKWKENPISASYDLHWIPTMFLVSPEMKILGVAFTADEMEALLAKEIK